MKLNPANCDAGLRLSIKIWVWGYDLWLIVTIFRYPDPMIGRVNGLGMEKMAETERIEVETDTVGCDGGGGPLGHPMVYLKIIPSKGGETGNEGPRRFRI